LIFWTLVGVALLIPVRLVGGWAWVAPGVAAAIMSIFVQVIFKRAPQGPLGLGMAIMTTLATVWGASQRQPSWWRMAEGIPFDETILESISNGLVMWGPTINPMHHELGGRAAFAYHHLLYLIVGLLNRFVKPEPYEALLIAAPVFVGVSIVATLLLLVKFVVRKIDGVSAGPLASLLVVSASLIGLDNDSTGGPSSWFGIASLLGSILLLLCIVDGPSQRSGLLLFVISMSTVAFSKGPFVWMPVVVALFFSILKWKDRWKLAVVAVVWGAALTLLLSSSNVQVPSYEITFWPYQTMASEFSISFYSLLVFVNVLITPLAICIPALALLLQSRSLVVRQIAGALSLVIALAIVARLFIDADWPNAAQVYYDVGVVAASLVMLNLMVYIKSLQSFSTTWTVSPVILAVTLVVILRNTVSETLTAQNLGAALSLSLLIVQVLSSRRVNSIGKFRSQIISSISFFLISLFLAQYISDTRWIPSAIGRPVETRYEDWYGSSQFRDLRTFVQTSTPASSLFAYSIKQDDSLDDYEIDYRPAALLNRRFLALHPLFDRADVSPQLWSDVEASRQIGVVPARKSIDYLAKRGVSYLLVDRSQIYPKWLQDAQDSGAVLEFDTSELVLLKLDV